MAIASQEMFQICRFCLCQDEALLIPLEDILDFALAFQDVSAVTGLEINEDNIASYAMCLECTTKLKSSVAFREACRSNDTHFQELCAVLSASVNEPRTEIKDKMELVDSCDESIDLDLDFLDTNIDDSPESSKSYEEFSQNDNVIEEHDESLQSINAEGEVFSYCANYIPPGETVFSEEEYDDLYDWDMKLNPAVAHRPRFKEPYRRNKLRLCDICAVLTTGIASHMQNHEEEGTFSCPHCPVKTKKKHNITQHIQTVHLKTVTKTCEICGKGFVHHKTYRYHMFTHQDEGKTFECKNCSKTFKNSIYLRDHMKRVHNAATQSRKKHPGGSSGRKRSRSNTVIEQVKD
ncbi:zinc finger protein 57-like [Anopheles marshallii]|uniref:zinc finger protein 57-like n=1 Tax=Anopheles marshallii TaxID=1521116 RepID=UPI00237B001F|nr:zinc finger protein 57-like [Anopheles marshallii]